MNKIFIIFIVSFMCISFVSSEIYDDCNIYGNCVDGSTTSSTTSSGNYTNLSQLDDTTITTPADGEVLTWSSAVMQWVNSVASSATKWILDSSPYWSNDSNTIYFNETYLNSTIDSRATGLGDNASWNQTFASTLYSDIIWGYNQTYSGSTYNATYASITGGNASWNETMANDLYLKLDTTNNPLTGDLNITHPGNHSKINLHSTGSYGTALTFNNDGAGRWSLRVPFASNDIGFYSYEDGLASFFLDSTTSKGSFARDLLVGDDFEVGDNVYINGTTWIYESLNVSENITASHFIGDGSYLTGIDGGNASWNQTYANDLYVNIDGDIMTGTLNTPELKTNSITSDGFDTNIEINATGVFHWN